MILMFVIIKLFKLSSKLVPIAWHLFSVRRLNIKTQHAIRDSITNYIVQYFLVVHCIVGPKVRGPILKVPQKWPSYLFNRKLTLLIDNFTQILDYVICNMQYAIYCGNVA